MAAAEAALVGGLADWFAVTALFRHPLGIPIPHTAIVVRQRERIGRVLGNFVQQHFLAREVVANELRRLRPAERIARWLAQPENATRAAAHLQSGFARALQAVPDDELRAMIRKAAVERVSETPLAPLLSDVLTAVTTEDRHHGVLDQALQLIIGVLHDHGDSIREQLHRERPWYVPSTIDSAIYKQVLKAMERTLSAIQSDAQHPLRARIDDALRNFVQELRHSPTLGERTEQLKHQVLNAEVVEGIVDGVWDSVRASAIRFGEDGVAPTEGLVRGLVAAGTALLANDEALRELDERLIDAAAESAEHNRAHVGELVARTIQSWDPAVAASRLELAVGPDLQYIRINGTLVGSLAGVGIHAMAKVLP